MARTEIGWFRMDWSVWFQIRTRDRILKYVNELRRSIYESGLMTS